MRELTIKAIKINEERIKLVMAVAPLCFIAGALVHVYPAISIILFVLYVFVFLYGLKIYEKTILKMDNNHLSIYWKLGRFYEIPLENIKSIKIERSIIARNRISVYLKNGEIHDFPLSIRGHARLSKVKEFIGGIA